MSKSSKTILWVIAGVIVLLALYIGTTYNNFVALNETADAQWAHVETQYQRRLDLIPNLVAAVKGILRQEQAVFGEIAQARTQYAGAKTVNEKVAAANQLESSFARLLVIVENYPQLKSSENIQALQTQIEGTENRISVERMRFNEAIKEYNIKAKRFPSNIVASMFGFDERKMFEAVPGAETAPKVDLEVK